MIVGLALVAGLGADELWDQAVELHGMYGTLLPGRMLIRFEQYNARDRLVSEDESELRIYLDDSGEIRNEVMSATQNGKDVTDERGSTRSSGSSGSPFGGPPSGAQNSENGDSNAFSGLLKSPFDPAEQPNVRVTAGPVERVGSVRAQRFDYVHDTGASSLTTGSAWLAIDDGTPIRLLIGLDPLPRFVDDFSMTQSFGRDPMGRWVTVETTFEGTGSFLFIKRRIESRLIFSDYFAPD